MSKVVSGNYTSPVAASYHSQDSDIYSRNDSFTGFLQDLDVHDGRTGKGLAVGRITTTAIVATGNTGEIVTQTGGVKITDGVTQNNLLDVVQNGATAYKCIGLTGATAASRYVGGTTTGAPSSGTFAVGDFIVAQDGFVWVCTTAGTPGTWRRQGPLPGTTTGYTAGTTDPASGFLTDGRAISRTTYATAFGVTGTAFGVGDGATTYNIPDKRSRVWMGADNMGTATGAASRASGNVALGNTSGEDTHTLTTGESAVLTYTSTDSGHAHQETNSTAQSGSGGANHMQTSNPSGSTPNTGAVDVTVAASAVISTSANAGGGAHNNRQLAQIVNEVYWV